MDENLQPKRQVVVYMNISLDGVIQGPARPDEDRRGGFPFGGWAAPYQAMQSPEALQAMPEVGPLLLGRRTYKDLHGYWSGQAGNPFTGRLDRMEKYVVSNTLREPLPWVNSTLIRGDAAEGVAKLKAQAGKDIMVMGSGELIQSLMAENLVDLFVLLVHPLVLGAGRRLFTEGLPCTRLELVEVKPAARGVVVAVYRPAGADDQAQQQEPQ